MVMVMAFVCNFFSTLWLIWAATQVCSKADDQQSQCYTDTAYILVSWIIQWKLTPSLPLSIYPLLFFGINLGFCTLTSNSKFVSKFSRELLSGISHKRVPPLLQMKTSDLNNQKLLSQHC